MSEGYETSELKHFIWFYSILCSRFPPLFQRFLESSFAVTMKKRILTGDSYTEGKGGPHLLSGSDPGGRWHRWSSDHSQHHCLGMKTVRLPWVVENVVCCGPTNTLVFYQIRQHLRKGKQDSYSTVKSREDMKAGTKTNACAIKKLDKLDKNY